MIRVTDMFLRQPLKCRGICLLHTSPPMDSIHYSAGFDETFETKVKVKMNNKYKMIKQEEKCIFKMDRTNARRILDQQSINNFSQCQVNTRQFHSSNPYHAPRIIEIQNPIKLLTSHINFLRVKEKWDQSLDKEDFLHGSRLAVVTILNQISTNNFTGLKGLLSRKELQRLRHEVETVWTDNIRLNAGIHDSDVYLNIINNVRSQQIVHNKYFDIDVTILAKVPTQSSTATHMFLVEATFHREYTEGRFPDWIVTRFRLHLKPFKSFVGEDYVIIIL